MRIFIVSVAFVLFALVFFVLARVAVPEATPFDVAMADMIGQASGPVPASGYRAVMHRFWSDVTVIGSGPVLVLFVSMILSFLVLARHERVALVVGLCILSAAMSTYLLKAYFERPRPLSLETMIGIDAYSFPSGHSTISGAVYPMLGALLSRLVTGKRLKIYCIGSGILLMVLVGMSRVYLGVHYATDVLAGWSVGLSWALVSWVLLERLQRKGVVEPDPIAREVEPGEDHRDLEGESVSTSA